MLNSYTQPQVIKYVDGLESLLRGGGFAGRLNIVRSDGGTMSARSTKERPVDIAFSGPSGGVVGAAYLARRIGRAERAHLRHGRHVDRRRAVPRRRGRRSSARPQLGYYQFQARGADIHSVGAGGGSIAYLNLAGALQVGPAAARAPTRARPATAAAATSRP